MKIEKQNDLLKKLESARLCLNGLLTLNKRHINNTKLIKSTDNIIEDIINDITKSIKDDTDSLKKKSEALKTLLDTLVNRK
jgi:hypothetical protein